MKIWACKWCKKIMERRGTIHYCECGVTYLGIAEAWYNPNQDKREFLQ